MLIKTIVLDKSCNPVFQSQVEVDALYLMIAAESREQLCREKGAEFTAGWIPFLGKELIKEMESGKRGDPIDYAAINIALAAWLFGSIYGGIDAEAFRKSDLEFTITHEGIVKYTRSLSSV